MDSNIITAKKISKKLIAISIATMMAIIFINHAAHFYQIFDFRSTQGYMTHLTHKQEEQNVTFNILISNLRGYLIGFGKDVGESLDNVRGSLHNSYLVYSIKLIGVYRGTVYDFVSGTLGGLFSNVLTVLLFSGISFLLSHFLLYREKNIIYKSKYRLSLTGLDFTHCLDINLLNLSKACYD